MGLSISVGVLADLIANDEQGAQWLRESLKKVNLVLKENKLSIHVEPESIPGLASRDANWGFSYPDLHYLRRFVAYTTSVANWKPKPFPSSAAPLDDKILTCHPKFADSHLLFHSDCEGYYVPVDFPKPIIGPLEVEIPGEMIGSSQGLLRELVTIAPFLGIKLEDGRLSDAEANRIKQLIAEPNTPFFLEIEVWLALFEAASLSIEHRTAIVFG